MKLLKKINNNYVLASDSKGRTVIASGKGLGFLKMPCRISDLSCIEHVFYDVDDRFIRILHSVPERMLSITSSILEDAQQTLRCRLNPNLVFVLADHLQFAIQRKEKGISFDMGVSFEIAYLHPTEMEIGRRALALVNRSLSAGLPDSEAAIIAMHILESEPNRKGKADVQMSDIIEKTVVIMEDIFDIHLDRKSFSYYRFATHVKYLLERKMENKTISTDNRVMMDQMVEQFPQAYRCVLVMKQYLKETMQWEISEEEQLYLMLHINRMKEDCNLK